MELGPAPGTGGPGRGGQEGLAAGKVLVAGSALLRAAVNASRNYRMEGMSFKDSYFPMFFSSSRSSLKISSSKRDLKYLMESFLIKIY